MFTRAVVSVLSPRIGRSLALSRPWSHANLLLVYRSVVWNAAGGNSAMTRRSAWARSVTTSLGVPWILSAAAKNRRAAVMSPRAETYTSMTWSC